MLDDLPFETKILIGLLAPLTLTLICLIGESSFDWLAQLARDRSWPAFWLMLLAAYLVFAIALGGGRLFVAMTKLIQRRNSFQ
jgi:hypothetical protein